MAFVFSFWYIIMILLVAGIIACLAVFFQMDKKDKVMIEEFIREAQQPAEEKPQEEPKQVEEKAEVQE